MGDMFNLLSHTGPALRRLDVLIWSRAMELCGPAGQNHVPGLPSPTRSLAPLSYHTYPCSKLCPGEHPAYRRPQDYQISRQGARPAPKYVWGPTKSILQMLVVTRLRKFQMIQYLRDQEDTLHWVLARWAVGLSPGAPLSCS